MYVDIVPEHTSLAFDTPFMYLFMNVIDVPKLLPRARMREGVKQLVLSICQFVCQFVWQKILNLNIDRVKMISKTDSSIDIVKKVTYVYLTGFCTLCLSNSFLYLTS